MLPKSNTRQKEVLYLRHKLQKSLLARVYDPNEEEIKQISDFISRLERYPDLECSIIRSTKIYKLMKAILKLQEIPRDSEFQIKSRSLTLYEIYSRTLKSAEESAPMPVQESFERLGLLPSGVVNDWVLVIHAEEDNVVLEECSLMTVA